MGTEMLDCAAAICIALFSLTGANETSEQIDTCTEIVEKSWAVGVDPIGVVALGWHESRFNPSVVSSAKAVGPLQVLPRWWCPNKKREGCDLVAAGLTAYRHYVVDAKSFRDGICRYNSGKSCSVVKKSIPFAKAVDRLRKRLYRKLQYSECLTPGC